MKSRLFSAVSLLLVATVPLFVGCSKKEADKNVVRMGFTPAESSDRVLMNGNALAELLQKETGYKFETFVASNYAALVESMRAGKLDIVWMAPFAYVLAEKRADAQVILKSVRHGQAAQYSALIVRDDSPVKTLADLKGKTVAWTDPSSSSGYIMPKTALVAEGIDPDTYFSKQIWGGSHESVVLAVANGTVTAGATFSDDAKGSGGAWSKFEKNFKKGVKLRPVFVTPPMPSDTVTVTAELIKNDPAKVEKIKAALLKMGDIPEGKEALKNLYGIDSLVTATPADYEPLRKAAEKLGFEFADAPKKKAN